MARRFNQPLLLFAAALAYAQPAHSVVVDQTGLPLPGYPKVIDDFGLTTAPLVVNVGELRGGTRRNLVAAQAVAKLDLRARTQPEWQMLAAQVSAIAEAQELPGTRGRCRLYNHRPAMEPTSRPPMGVEPAKTVV